MLFFVLRFPLLRLSPDVAYFLMLLEVAYLFCFLITSAEVAYESY